MHKKNNIKKITALFVFLILMIFLIFPIIIYGQECNLNCLEEPDACSTECLEYIEVAELIVSDELKANITVTENISLRTNQIIKYFQEENERRKKLVVKDEIEDDISSEVNQTLNESLQNETKELETLVEQDDEVLQEIEAGKIQVGKFFIFLIVFAAFIFVVVFILGKKRKEKEAIKKIRKELIASLGFNEKLFNQLVAYIKFNINKGFNIKIIKRRLMDAGYNVYLVEKIIGYFKKINE